MNIDDLTIAELIELLEKYDQELSVWEVIHNNEDGNIIIYD